MATILVLEDDEGIRRFMKIALQMKEHTVQAFEDVAPALEEVDVAEVDLVLMDYHTSTSGEEVVLAIKKLDPDATVIVMSAFLPENTIEHLKALGAQDVVEKPFTVELLLKLVQKWV